MALASYRPPPVDRWRRRSTAPLALLASPGLLGGCGVGGDSGDRPPQLGAKSSEGDAAAKLGFPSSATRNTIRVGGGDAASDAAGVASAVFPATGNKSNPNDLALADHGSLQDAISASVLAG